MPNIVLPQTFKPPYGLKRAMGIVNESPEEDAGWCVPGGNIELDDGTINHSITSEIRHRGSDYFKAYPRLDLELRSVFDFYVQAPDTEETKKIAISIIGCRCYQSSDKSYDVKITDNFGYSGAEFDTGSDFIVTLNPANTSEDLSQEEPVYRNNLWHYGKKYSRRKINKHLEGDGDLSSHHLMPIPHGEG